MRRGVLMTMLQQNALTLPLWIGKPGEKLVSDILFRLTASKIYQLQNKGTHLRKWITLTSLRHTHFEVCTKLGKGSEVHGNVDDDCYSKFKFKIVKIPLKH